jgi:glycosyltransferase involved in cell wall biosynthesis
MKIGIDIRLYGESGNGRYLRNLLKNLYEIDSENSYVLFCLKKDLEEVTRLYGVRWKIVVADFYWYTFKEQFVLPFLLYRENLDLAHFPHFNIPLLYFKPFVVTIHDLTHFTFAMERASTHSVVTYRIKHAAYSLAFWWAVTFSRKIFAVSEYVKQDIIKKFGTNEEKIMVTYEAADSLLANDSGVSQEAISVKGDYFLYVGNAHPHKNIEFLIRSFQELRKKRHDIYLVLVGKESYFWERIAEWMTKEKLDEKVLYLGFVSDSQLNYLYKNAIAYVMPSLSEGFGLPILEAMQHDCPVISSDATCLAEIGGVAALYFDPKNIQSCVDSMELVLSDPAKRDELRSKGRVQVNKFSWKKMAEQTKQSYSN